MNQTRKSWVFGLFSSLAILCCHASGYSQVQTGGTSTQGGLGGGAGQGSSFGGTFGQSVGSLSGGGMQGGTNITTGSVYGVQQSNPFSAYYLNPYSRGVPSGTLSSTLAGGIQANPTAGSFGQALYTSQSGGAGGTTGFGGGGATGGRAGATGGRAGATGGRTTGGLGGTTGGRTTGGTTGLGGTTGFGGATTNFAGGNRAGGATGVGGANRGIGTTGGAGFGGTTAIGGVGRTGGIGGGITTGIGGAGYGFSTSGIPRNSYYTTGLGYTIRPRIAPVAQLQTNAVNVIARSNALPSKGNISINVDGRTVVLSGTVRSERERRHAESLVRITPGIRSVRNELTVNGQ